MRYFGPHTALVQEIIAFVEDGHVLENPYEPVDLRIGIATRTIVSLDDVERFRDPDWPCSKIRNKMSWTDIQRIDEQSLSSAWSQEFSTVTQPAIEAVRKSMWKSLETQLREKVPYHEIQEIDGYFNHLLYLRGASGLTASFDEKLFEIYRAGGYPCGWWGAYPDGELVVFSS